MISGKNKTLVLPSMAEMIKLLGYGSSLMPYLMFINIKNRWLKKYE